MRARRQYIEDLVKYYGKGKGTAHIVRANIFYFVKYTYIIYYVYFINCMLLDAEKHLRKLRNKPVSLVSERGKERKFGNKNKKPRKKISKNDRRKYNLFNFDKSDICYEHFGTFS